MLYEVITLTIVDMSIVLRQALEVIERVVHAVQVVFLFALAAGLLVLYAALLATEEERIREAALLRALGASRGQVRAAQRIEFIAIGVAAGVLAAAGAAGIGSLIAERVLNLPYTVVITSYSIHYTKLYEKAPLRSPPRQQ